MSERWLQRASAAFWDAAGEPPPPPRDLETAALWALPLAVCELPSLRVATVRAWLHHQSSRIVINGPDRPLRGCLVAYAGSGVILLDADDPADERRFTVAHEIAHFLVDYAGPREHAVAGMGPGIVTVLDGLRAPTVDERVDALLVDVPLGPHTHLMQRLVDGSLGCGRVAGAESRADCLALELLAPAQLVRGELERRGPSGNYRHCVDQTIEVLGGTFGLPGSVAESYGTWLCDGWCGDPTVRQWLGL
jgi:IrrE N-terminal-like domain